MKVLYRGFDGLDVAFQGRWDRFSFSQPNAIDLRERSTSFEGVGVTGGGAATLTGEGTPQRISLGRVTPGYFDMLGVTPLVGRTFRDTDVDATQPMRVLMLSEDLWITRFGSDPGVVDQTISLDGEGYLVVGGQNKSLVIEQETTLLS